MVYNLGFVIFFTNFSRTIGGGGGGWFKQQRAKMWDVD